MNLFNLFTEIEKADPEVYDRTSDRRSALKEFTGFATKVAAVSMPFMLGSMFKKAYGQTTTNIVSVLNYALTLEYLESEFYIQGVNRGTALIPSADLPAFQTIRDHEVAHVNFLKTAITSAGGTPTAKPTFDFTAGNGSNNGPYANVFTNYDTFLAVSQAFEDTGVRAYKGQAAALMSNKDVLTAALKIHSVEARHASHLRKMRSARGATNNDPWITGNNAGGVPGVTAIYAGEENTSQGGVQITNINGLNITAEDASEAFDEPLTMAQVLLIVDPFIV